MNITNEHREIFDKVAQRAIENAQLMIRSNPTLAPTQAYRLAFTYALEAFWAEYWRMISMQLEALKRSKE